MVNNFEKFIRHGVFLEIPVENAEKVEMTDVSLDNLKDGMGKADDNFTPYRLVVKLEPGGFPAETKLRVYFTHDDLKHISRPNLAYWKDEKWNPFDEINRFPLPGNLIWAGYLEVIIGNMGDPPIALGE